MFFKNKEIKLPKFTFFFEQELEKIESLNKQLITGEIGRATVLNSCYMFLTKLLTEKKLLEILESDNFDDVDMKELELLFFYIKTEYEKPIEEAIAKKEQDKINGLFKNTNISEIIKLSEKISNKNNV